MISNQNHLLDPRPQNLGRGKWQLQADPCMRNEPSNLALAARIQDVSSWLGF